MITVQTMPHAARLIDTTAVLSGVHAPMTQLKLARVDGVVRYHESLSADEVHAITDAGLGLSIVGYARFPRSWTPSQQLGAFDAAASLSKVNALGMSCGFDPAGLTHWCDLEGAAGTIEQVTGYCNGFASGIVTGGGAAGLYVGDDQPLTGAMLAALPDFTHYWRAFNAVLPDLPLAYQMVQLFPTQKAIDTGFGFDVDYDFVQTDVKGRRPTWLKAV
jgi:hypothetical protein